MSASRAGLNAVAAWGWAHRESIAVAPRRATDKSLRAVHPEIPAQLVISARMKATVLPCIAAPRRGLAEEGSKVTTPHW
ncbi:MAG TPA: hypothetical protein VGJ20_41775 [Xanthobacteraceae bacterium]